MDNTVVKSGMATVPAIIALCIALLLCAAPALAQDAPQRLSAESDSSTAVHTIDAQDEDVAAGNDLAQATVEGVTDKPWTGNSQYQTDLVVVLDGKTLNPETDYSVRHEGDLVDVGTAMVVITAKPNSGYTGSKNVTYQITKADMSTTWVSNVSNRTYNGNKQWQEPLVKYQGNTLEKDVDYTLTHDNNTNAGTASVTVHAKEGSNFTGSQTVEFKINPISLYDSNIAITGVTNRTYTGGKHWQNPTVKWGSKTLVKGTDYTVEHVNNLNAGTASVTITGIGNFSSAKRIDFRISPASISPAIVTGVTPKTWTGKAVYQTPTVKWMGKTLVKGTDYYVTHSNNVKPGTASLKITGKGNFTGTKSMQFEISAVARAKDGSYYQPIQGTGNDCGVINEAITKASAASKNGSQVEVRLQWHKTYTIGNSVGVKSNVKLNLNGGTIKRSSASSIYDMIKTTSPAQATGYNRAKNFTITNGTLDANYSKTGKTMQFSHSQGITISNATIMHGRSDHIIAFDGVKGGTVWKVTFTDCIADKSNNPSIRHLNEAVHIDSCVDRVIGSPGDIDKADGTISQDILVQNCVFDGVCTAVGAHYHDVSGNKNGKPDPVQKNIRVINNTFKKIEPVQANGNGGTALTAARTDGWKVSGNTAKNSGATFFARLNGCQNFTIANNTVDNVSYFVFDNGGPKTSKLTSNGRLSGNKVSNIKYSAFRAYETNGTFTLDGEQYSTARASYDGTAKGYNSADNCLLLVKGCTATIQNCTFANLKAPAVKGISYLTTMKLEDGKFTFRNNTVNQAPASGLCLTKAKSGSSVTGNTFTNCGGAAKGTDGFTLILDGGSTGTTVSSNTLKGCKGGGIYVKEASRNTVSKNTIAVAGGKKIINLYNTSNSTVTGNTGGSNAVAIGGNCSGNKIS